MKFAIVNGKRHEAAHGLIGHCPACGAALIAKCGDLRVHHWAHKGTRDCDTWWEPETEWHRNWKDRFPKHWQEVVHRADDGEKHIADVKTERGGVLEFQHSPISIEERAAREAFYRRMVWIIDGTRRKRDLPSFLKSLRNAILRKTKPVTLAMPTAEGALLRDWAGSGVPVYFDFGDEYDGEEGRLPRSVLWRLDPKSPDDWAYIAPVFRVELENAYTNGRSPKGMNPQTFFREVGANWQPGIVIAAQPPLALSRQASPKLRPLSFQQYMARKQRARSRVRF